MAYEITSTTLNFTSCCCC